MIVKVWCSPSVLGTTWSSWYVDSWFYLLINWQSKADDLWKRIGWNYINDQQVFSDIRFAHDIFMFDIKRGNLNGFTQMIQLLWRVLAALTSSIIKRIVCCLSNLPIVSKNNQQIHSAKNTIVKKKELSLLKYFVTQGRLAMTCNIVCKFTGFEVT